MPNYDCTYGDIATDRDARGGNGTQLAAARSHEPRGFVPTCPQATRLPLPTARRTPTVTHVPCACPQPPWLEVRTTLPASATRRPRFCRTRRWPTLRFAACSQCFATRGQRCLASRICDGLLVLLTRLIIFCSARKFPLVGPILTEGEGGWCWRQDAVAVGTVIGSCEQRRSRFAAGGGGWGTDE